jgi:hypothetical protein
MARERAILGVAATVAGAREAAQVALKRVASAPLAAGMSEGEEEAQV